MKGRLMNLFLQKRTGAALVAIALCAAVAAGSLVTFRSARAETPMAAQEALDALTRSVSMSEKELTFTIPQAYQEAGDWRIQVSGRYRMGEGQAMSVHLVENDGADGRWKGGEGSYSIPLTDYDLDQFEALTLWAFLSDEDGMELEREVDLLALRRGDLADGSDQRIRWSDTEAENGLWSWPVPEHQEITAYFGARVHPITGLESSHDGVDISAPEGAAVVAVGGGVVAETGWDETDGNYVLLDHGDGLTTLYGCLRAYSVQTGERVERGAALGAVGDTGAATGPHLHWEVYQNGSLVDPLSCFPPAPEADGEPEEPSIEGTDFTYGGRTYDLAERDPSITAITAWERVGEYLLLECHTGPKHNIYLVFDPQTETFVKELGGSHLIWKGEDLTTAVHAFWGEIRTWDGAVLATMELGETGYISALSFTENGEQVEVEITENEGRSTRQVALP